MLNATPKRFRRARRLLLKGGAYKVAGEGRKPWCTKRATRGRSYPGMGPEDNPMRAAAQVYGVRLIEWLHRRAGPFRNWDDVDATRQAVR